MRCLTFLLISVTLGAGADAPWATSDEYGAFRLVVGPEAEASERGAAEVLQRYWKEATGHDLPIADHAAEGPAVYVGFEAVPDELMDGVVPGEFGGQEVWIKSFEDSGAPRLAIAGGRDGGTEYGVYQFLEDAFGIRWLAPGVTHIPPAPDSLAHMDYRYEPVFEYRWSTYLARVDDQEGLAEYRRAHRWLAGPGFSCHTFYSYVPPERYFEEHPEYFSLVDGKRIAPTYDYYDHLAHRDHPGEQGQLCMTNTDVLDIIYAKIEADIAANPANRVHHISQMDWDNYCECETCAAIDGREESHMGAVLWGLNRLAERLAEDYPEHRIETLAYTWTRKPPKHMKPHDNVIIKLCSIECDFSRPFDDPDSQLNRNFAEDIDRWSQVAARLHVWDYLTNFYNFQSPVPNFHVIGPNMRFLAAHRVKGMFPQGAYDDVAEFTPLRAYVLSKMMWDPRQDVQALIDEFIRLYYREAGPYVHEYIDLLSEQQQSEGLPMTCFDRGRWYDYGTVERARAIFDRAFAAVQSEEVKHRLDILYTTVQYGAFKCPPKATIADSKLILERPESQTFDEYFSMLKDYGIKNINDYFALTSFVEQTGGEMPPRHLESELVTLENDRYLLWVAPELDGSVIRWRDKELDLELLRGFQEYGKVPGTWEDWSTRPGVEQRPVASSYDVVEQSSDALVLRAKLGSGAVVERTMQLRGETIEVRLAFENQSDEPQKPLVKVHPEFFTQGMDRPEIWLRKDGAWSDVTEDLRPGLTAHGTIASAKGLSQLAAYLPPAGASIVCRPDAAGVGNVLYFFNVNPEAQHVNLELLPANGATVAPGERHTIRGSYSVQKGRPQG